MSSQIFAKARIPSIYGRIIIGELVGIYFATVIIYSNFLQYALTPTNQVHSYFGFCFAVGMGIGMGGYISAFVSPLAPINPSVCIGMSAGGYIPVKRVPIYLFGQFIGTFLAQLTVYGLYYEAIMDFTTLNYNGTLKIPEAAFLCAFPMPHTSIPTQIANIFFVTGTLVIGVNAIMDKRNFDVPVSLQPILFGILIIIILGAFSYNAGGTMNFLMDLSGRIVLTIFGWGSGVWTYGNYYSWMPIVIGPIGAICFANVYNLLISPNLPMSDNLELTVETGGEVKVDVEIEESIKVVDKY